MGEEWLSLDKAIELVRQLYGTGIGYARKLVKDARESGEVRSQLPGGPVYLEPDDGLIGFGPMPLSKDDFLDWLRRHPDLVAHRRDEAKAVRKKPARKLELARLAIEAKYPNGPPSALSDKDLCASVRDSGIGDTTILRAAGRRKD